MKNWIPIWLVCKLLMESYGKSYTDSYTCRRPLRLGSTAFLATETLILRPDQTVPFKATYYDLHLTVSCFVFSPALQQLNLLLPGVLHFHLLRPVQLQQDDGVHYFQAQTGRDETEGTGQGSSSDVIWSDWVTVEGNLTSLILGTVAKRTD
jgi:hypothetical protein